MTEDEIIALFNDEDSWKMEFKDVTEKLSYRPDVHAFILLDQLCPGVVDLVSGSDYERYFLRVSAGDLARAGATQQQIEDLIRSGVSLDEDSGDLYLFS